jgi:hypothetical protein
MRVRLKKRCLLPSGYKADLARKVGIVTVTPLGGPAADYLRLVRLSPTADVRQAMSNFCFGATRRHLRLGLL